MRTEPRHYHSLPELDTSLPDNDLGGMVGAITWALLAIGLLTWWLKA